MWKRQQRRLRMRPELRSEGSYGKCPACHRPGRWKACQKQDGMMRVWFDCLNPMCTQGSFSTVDYDPEIGKQDVSDIKTIKPPDC
jgi:hypothetical protein